MEKKSKILTVVILVAIVGGSVGGGIWYFSLDHRTPLKIFLAGSLTEPLEEIEAIFELAYPDVDVQLSAAGSSVCVSWITGAGKVADVLALADWDMIPAMSQTYQNYTIQFATNQMVLCWNGTAPLVGMTKDNFWEYLNQEHGACTWAFSNPNLDPCGYRTLMLLQMAELKYANTTILEDIVFDQAAITGITVGMKTNISCNEDLNPTGNLQIRDKSVDLVTLLKEGSLTYAFEYMSVAIQHELSYVTFDPELALNETTLEATWYNNVTVYKNVDTASPSSSKGKSITYGVTVLQNADQPALGAIFVEYMINGTGDGIFNSMGQPTLDPCPTVNYGPWMPANLYGTGLCVST